MLQNKKVLLGVCGSIAAYKSAFLIRLLVKAGADVRVIMTPSAADFISPLTLATLSKNPVYSEYFNPEAGTWNNHVELALWADVLLIAPATANTLAAMAMGLCDNLLLAVWLSARSKVLVAPAMDLDMYVHPTTLRNLASLESMGVGIVPAETGELASGLNGQGRMAEPEHIVAFLETSFQKQDFAGKTVLVNAGPTHEFIDPVRFIGNMSSGKMGICIAEEIADRGGKVFLVLGPVNLRPNHPNIEVHSVVDAENMFGTCTALFSQCDGAILAAAVADYRPEVKSDTKIKKNSDHFELSLVKTPDTLAELGKMKSEKQVLFGFALETDHEIENAIKKLTQKNLDSIVLNSLRDETAGFGKDTNKITIIDKSNGAIPFETKTKRAVAKDIADHFLSKF